ncbi:HAD family hydrolase [Marinithermus hydrothermalis]|uniref:HAD-superfamily hydrolase, subfamily IA, variant 3 n=1 Tax=Marinithermus hydrothermalis (strain DSM 14884 / JCM 11576 / T1) TaxID=869210 RepID=F2NQB6_MARHT|nr:HAD family hydrolase [Marinithermus hydrothermalis]AEB11643.1 HAD-superfamily hydrolase, subfamily IA, variant 3 [Marinithermus hydrothermalis DSM 14884]
MKAFLFDMDDTLLEPVRPSPLLEFKRRWGLPNDHLVIEGLSLLPETQREIARGAFHQLEREVAQKSRVRPGMRAVLRALRRAAVPTALITNNNPEAVQIVLQRHRLEFSLVLTRADGRPKPAPDLIEQALAYLKVRPEEALFVGDSHADRIAAEAAGVPIVFLPTPDNADLHPRLRTPQELLAFLDNTRPSAIG